MSSPLSSPSGTAAGTSGPSTSHLDHGSLSMLPLRNLYRQELSSILSAPYPISSINPASSSSSPPRRVLILDKSLSGPLNLIAEPDFLRQCGVETMYYLAPGEFISKDPNLTYLIRPTLANIRLISSHVLDHREKGKKHTYSIIFWQRKPHLCERELEEQGVKGDITSTSTLTIDLLPFEWDVLSLEHPTAFKECFLEGDPSSLYLVARSIMRLQGMFGLIPVVKGKGNNAMRVCNLMQQMRLDMSSLFTDHKTSNPHTSNHRNTSTYTFPSFSDISELILLDRSVDLITPMLTQLTYEGLLDELYIIKNSTIDVDAAILGTSEKDKEKERIMLLSQKKEEEKEEKKQLKKLLLTSADSIYEEVRDLAFRSIGPLLARKLSSINATFEERHEAMGLSVHEMKKYMEKFKVAHNERQWLTIHVNLADAIAPITTKSKIFDRKIDIEKNMLEGVEIENSEEYIESMIAKGESLSLVLRLLCLLSLTTGIRTKKYDTFKRDILHTYGYKHVFTLISLERLGLLSAQKRNFTELRKKMKLLIAESMSGGKERGIDYTYEGYAPILIRCIEYATANERSYAKDGTLLTWKTFDYWNLLPGQLFDIKQDKLSTTLNTISTNPFHNSTNSSYNKNNDDDADLLEGIKPICLVYFIGGVTFAEISALRWLSQRQESKYEYIVATTKLINGSTLLQSIEEKMESHLNIRSVRFTT